MHPTDLTIATEGRAPPSPPLTGHRPTPAAALVAAAVAVLTLLPGPALGQAAEGTSLGGGSDLDAGQVVAVPAGGGLPPLHSLFVENPEDHAVEVAFTAEAPEGIQVTGAWKQRTLAGGETARNAFAVEVGGSVAAGDHEVYVQIARADIRSDPGQLTGIPAVGARFTVRVVGESAQVTVHAVSDTTGEPVDGTLSLAAMSEDGSTFEVQRAVGSQLDALVAPGQYRATFLLGDRIMAEDEVHLTAGDSTAIQLKVQTVAFTLTDVRPIYDQGRLAVVDLTAAVHNEIGEIADAVLQVSVHRDGAVDAVELQRFPVLPEGVSEATVTYRPQQGWAAGEHRFIFELVTPDFTLVASDQPELMVADTRPGWMPTALAGSAALALIGLIMVFVRRRRLGAPRPRPPDPPPMAHRPVPDPPMVAPPMVAPPMVAPPMVAPPMPAPRIPDAHGPPPMPEPSHPAIGVHAAAFAANTSDTRRRWRT